MPERDAIAHQVLNNCSISDARHAGFYSICGLALRLRDLYKWEHGLAPWVEKDTASISEWIGNKEQQWENLTGQSIKDITILGNKYDPFDSLGINSVLESHGLIYGGGYASSLKPTFFLAPIEDKKEINGHPVFILGRELARDLLTLPALSQDNCILVRRESAKLFVWDKMFYIKKSGRQALRFALENFGIKEQNSKAIQRSLGKIVGSETETYIYHELGEIQDTVLDRDLWREILATFPHTAIELLVRTVKDLLADTNEYGTLRHITRERKTASLAFYVAFLEGLLKELFPEIIEAFEEFTQKLNWSVIDQAVNSGYNTAKQYAETISFIYREGRRKNDNKWVEKEISRQLLEPLGIKGLSKE